MRQLDRGYIVLGPQRRGRIKPHTERKRYKQTIEEEERSRNDNDIVFPSFSLLHLPLDG